MLHGFIACVPDPDHWLKPHANAVGLEPLGGTPGAQTVALRKSHAFYHLGTNSVKHLVLH